MSFKGLIDMSNENALIALAYLRENDNPLIVFSNFIMYCLISSEDKKLRHDQLTEKIETEFGLRMPPSVIKICVKLLKKQNRISVMPNGGGYAVISDGDFNEPQFELARETFKQNEKSLIDELLLFVNNLGCEWNYETARINFTHFLVERENAAKLFIENNVEDLDQCKQIPASWYIGKFIIDLLKKDNPTTEHLITIVNGLMVYIAVWQTNNYQEEKNRKFKGTDFYFDTKLVLRALGYSWPLEVDAVQEMIKLIRDEYEGNICIFEHTIGEIEAALMNVEESLIRNEFIIDRELRIFAELNKATAFDFRVYIDSLRENVEKLKGFRIQSPVNWNTEAARSHNLDWNELKDFIKGRHPNWKLRAIENDVAAIIYINILRNGDYSDRIGGKNHLPIFITSNSALVNDFRQYIIEHREQDAGIANWNLSALPLITDNTITYRLWLPKAQSYSALPALTIARSAFAAQQASNSFIERFRKAAQELKNKHNVDIINISDVRKSLIEEYLMKESGGDVDNITPEVVATSVEQLIFFETKALQNNIKDLSDENASAKIAIKLQKDQIVRSTSARLVNKLGWRRCLIIAAQYWWVICAIFFGLLNVVFVQKLSIVGISFVIPIVVKLLEKLLEKSAITKWLINSSVRYVWKKYSNYIKSSLSGLEKDFSSEILGLCLSETKLLNKYIHVLGDGKITISQEFSA